MEIWKTIQQFFDTQLLGVITTFLGIRLFDFFKAIYESRLKRAEAVDAIRFARFHNKSASVIAKTYCLLGSLLATAQDIIQSDEYLLYLDYSGKFTTLMKEREAFVAYFYKNRIFLPKEAVSRIDEFDETLERAITEFWQTCAVNHATKKNWDPVKRAIDTRLPKILKELEGKFRELLGSS